MTPTKWYHLKKGRKVGHAFVNGRSTSECGLRPYYYKRDDAKGVFGERFWETHPEKLPHCGKCMAALAARRLRETA